MFSVSVAHRPVGLLQINYILTYLFLVLFSVTFHLMHVKIVFNSVFVAELPTFGKELPARLTLCSLCIMSICNLVIPLFGFEGSIWVLIAPVPGHCLLLAFRLWCMFRILMLSVKEIRLGRKFTYL